MKKYFGFVWFVILSFFMFSNNALAGSCPFYIAGGYSDNPDEYGYFNAGSIFYDDKSYKITSVYAGSTQVTVNLDYSGNLLIDDLDLHLGTNPGTLKIEGIQGIIYKDFHFYSRYNKNKKRSK